MPSELLGLCVVYLGGLNYFFPVDEHCPVVSKIGTTDGHLHVQITPYIGNTSASASSGASRSLRALEQSDSGDGFVRFEHKNVDAAEEQVYEYMDRTLQYRVHIGALSNVPRRARKFSHLYVRYSFFKAGVAQTAPVAVHDGSDDVYLNHERRLAVDVTDAFVKYVASTNLTLEVFGCNQPDGG